MSSNEVQDLLRRGIEAARDNDRATARELLQRAVELDDKNEKAWFWLASVVDTVDERRVCLSNVLHLNPNNEKARQAMDALESKARQKANQEEVIPGVTRSQMTFILGGGILAVVVIVVAFAAIVISNNNAAAARAADQTRVAQVATDTLLTATQDAANAAATLAELATDTPIPPTATSNIPTLPPVWTATPSPTMTPTEAPLAPITGLTGNLAVYTGRDVLSNGYLTVGYFNLAQGGLFTSITDQYGRDPSFRPDGTRIIYTRYDQLTFGSVIDSLNLNGTDVQTPSMISAGVPILDPQQARYSANGQMFVFIAKSTSTNHHVFVYNILEGSVRQLTNNDSEYSYPDFSPDGTKIVVVRNDVNSATPGADLVLIDLSSGGQVPVTNDRSAFTETMPRYLDDRTIVYAVAPGTDPNNYDIMYRPSNGTGSAQPLVVLPGRQMYPVVSRDHSMLAYASDESGAWDIYLYNISNQTTQQLTRSPEADYPTDWWQP